MTTVSTTSIDGLLIISSLNFDDERGFFRETWRLSELSAALGRVPNFVQNNHSRSHAGVLRGFHLEAWDKLIYVPRGTITCAIGDPRPDSASFGKVETIRMGDKPGERIRIFVSQGLCNSFYCHTEVDYLNDVSGEFNPHNRRGIRWDDPIFAVDWPDRNPILGAWDASLPMLSDLISGSDPSFDR